MRCCVLRKRCRKGRVREFARKLYTVLEAEQKRMRDLDVEWGQLRLEQSTWAAHGRIEKVARERLHMNVPQAGRVVVIEPVTQGSKP